MLRRPCGTYGSGPPPLTRRRWVPSWLNKRSNAFDLRPKFEEVPKSNQGAWAEEGSILKDRTRIEQTSRIRQGPRIGQGPGFDHEQRMEQDGILLAEMKPKIWPEDEERSEMKVETMSDEGKMPETETVNDARILLKEGVVSETGAVSKKEKGPEARAVSDGRLKKREHLRMVRRGAKDNSPIVLFTRMARLIPSQ